MRFLTLSSLVCALLGSALVCNAAPPASNNQPPSTGDIKEEQRLIGNAYLGDADFQISQARERVGMNNLRLAQQSGLWALEQLAYAKRRLESHAARIETMVNWLGVRVTEGTRREYRESYAKLRQRYANVENSLEVIATRLESSGYPILNQVLGEVRSSGGRAAVEAVKKAFKQTNTEMKGDVDEANSGGGGGGGGGGPTTSGGNPDAGRQVTLPGGGGNLVVTPDGVTIDGRTYPGNYDAATNTLTSASAGKIDFKTTQVNSNGIKFAQSDKGVFMIPPGELIPGARLNSDGTITFANGSIAKINDISVNPEGQIMLRNQDGSITPIGPDGIPQKPITGPLTTQSPDPVPSPGNLIPAGPLNPKSTTTFQNQNGEPITVDGDAPPFVGGRRSFIRKIYLGAPNTILTAETKVDQQLLNMEGDMWKVNQTLGESRKWMISAAITGNETAPGKTTMTFKAMDSSGNTAFTISNVTIESDAGRKIDVQPMGSTGSYQAVFTQSDSYTVTVKGKTDWGSEFSIETSFQIGVN